MQLPVILLQVQDQQFFPVKKNVNDMGLKQQDFWNYQKRQFVNNHN